MSKILIVEDEPDVRGLIKETLELEGYETLTAADGEEAEVIARRELPHLILLDVMLPRKNGYEVVRDLRRNVKTAHIPVIMLTARSGTSDKVTGLEVGADDYVTKPFDTEELLARVRAQLRIVERTLLSELTGLPGNTLIERAIRQVLNNQEAKWAVLYIDLDDFKAYNDVYGFIKGNELIKATADIISDAVARVNGGSEFVGHIGGDDFVVITSPDKAVPISEDIIARFDRERDRFYSKEDLARGYIVTTDRRGRSVQFPLVSISIGVVSNQFRKIRNQWEVGEIAAEVKKKAKATAGSAYYVDQRR